MYHISRSALEYDVKSSQKAVDAYGVLSLRCTAGWPAGEHIIQSIENIKTWDLWLLELRDS